MDDITENELLQLLVNQLQFAEGADDEFRTCQEIQDELGWSVQRIRKHLRDLMTAGRVETKWIYRQDISGRVNKRPGYRVIK